MGIKKGAYNSILGIISMIIVGGISFFKISLIINILGNKYNGLNNLYSQIFNFLMIGEAGIGLATTSLLYKHIAENNIEKINEIISGSRKILTMILGSILLIIVIASFGIPYLIKDDNFSKKIIVIAFIIFSIKAIIPQYLQPFKGYIAANQDEYILKIYQIISAIFIGLVEILAIYIYRDFLIMLLIGMLITIFFEYLMYIILKKQYPYIRFFNSKKNFEASKHIKELIKVNIVGTVAKSVDPIIISKILGLIMTSLYSNYSYVLNFLLSILGIGIGGFTHYFGDIFAKKCKNMKKSFDKYIILTNFLASFFTIMFFIMIPDFISLWINSKSILEFKTALLFSLLIYIYTIMKPINTLVVTNRYFKIASKSSIYETFINLSISLFLIKKIGLNGVLLGSIISFIVSSFWYFPVKTYKEVFKYSSKDYFFKQLKSILILVFIFYLIINIPNFFDVSLTWNYFIVKGLLISMILFVLIIVVYIICFKEMRELVLALVNQIKKKLCNKY